MDQVGEYQAGSYHTVGDGLRHGWGIVSSTRSLAGERWGNTGLVGNLLGVTPGLYALAECPVCHQTMPVGAIVLALNDEDLWTFDQIADWLDGLHNSGAVDLSVDNPEPELIGA